MCLSGQNVYIQPICLDNVAFNMRLLNICTEGAIIILVQPWSKSVMSTCECDFLTPSNVACEMGCIYILPFIVPTFVDTGVRKECGCLHAFFIKVISEHYKNIKIKVCSASRSFCLICV